jgi:hypothetical protein
VYGVLGCDLMALVRTFGDNAGDQTEVKIKGVFMAVFSAVEKIAFKVQHVSVWLGRRVQTCCTGLPARFPIKTIYGQLVLSQQPAIVTATTLVNITWTTPSGHSMLNQ